MLRSATSSPRSPGVGSRRSLDVADELDLDEETEQLFYRAASEAIRNVERHADARHLVVRVGSGDGWARLEVVDDGVGFTQEDRDRSRAEGHVGLSLLEELAARMGGTPRGAIDARRGGHVRPGGTRPHDPRR